MVSPSALSWVLCRRFGKAGRRHQRRAMETDTSTSDIPTFDAPKLWTADWSMEPSSAGGRSQERCVACWMALEERGMVGRCLLCTCASGFEEAWGKGTWVERRNIARSTRLGRYWDFLRRLDRASSTYHPPTRRPANPPPALPRPLRPRAPSHTPWLFLRNIGGQLTRADQADKEGRRHRKVRYPLRCFPEEDVSASGCPSSCVMGDGVEGGPC
jgi:hypothetical protein